MYSSQKNILQLVSLLKAHKIGRVVVSSGSRNAPVIQSLANDAFFTCHTVVDERSAGFYALGIAQYTKETVALCCTSGTAVLNYGPAVAEAYYRQLPLVVITADRPAARIGQGLGQTLPQPGIFNALAKRSVQLPDIHSAEDEWYCNRLINEALLEATHHRRGPVHINIPLSEPLFEYTEKQLPQVRTINRCLPRSGTFGDYGRRFLMYRKRMFIAGQSDDPRIAHELNKLIEAHDCVVLTEHLSNIPPAYYIRNFDAMLCGIPENESAHYAPGLLITTGGHIVSKRIKQFLQANPPQEHWHISPSGEIVDTYQCLTDVVEAESADFIHYLSRQVWDNHQPKSFAERWLSRSVRIPEPKVGFSDIMAVGALLKAMPETANLQLANGSAVRLAQLFRLQGCPKVFSNRGTSGIDGCLSTAIGQAAVSEDLTFLLIGDLAFFYDMNVLWNRLIPPRMRILLNNNGGGGIFHTLPGFEKSGITEKHITVQHAVSAKSWAEDRGFTYLPVSGEPELHAHMPAFVCQDAPKPVLMEVFTSKEKNAEILQNYYASLKKI